MKILFCTFILILSCQAQTPDPKITPLDARMQVLLVQEKTATPEHLKAIKAEENDLLTKMATINIAKTEAEYQARRARYKAKKDADKKVACERNKKC